MRHLRSDYDAIQPWPVKRAHHGRIGDVAYTDLEGHDLDRAGPLIPDDEPVFLIRGQDPAGHQAVRAYARHAEDEGADPGMVDAIARWADEMEAYAERVQHGPPDAPEGTLRADNSW